jgi:hypothetical protein
MTGVRGARRNGAERLIRLMPLWQWLEKLLRSSYLI